MLGQFFGPFFLVLGENAGLFQGFLSRPIFEDGIDGPPAEGEADGYGGCLQKLDGRRIFQMSQGSRVVHEGRLRRLRVVQENICIGKGLEFRNAERVLHGDGHAFGVFLSVEAAVRLS